ncbi:MAG: AEC family transporter [Clostridia bacterium]|nr:AEC family transporter [Clostridia bacterium]
MFLTVLEQVAILFILIGIGYLLGKGKIIAETGAKQMTDICLLIVTPCVVIKSFLRPFSTQILKAVLTSFLLAFFTQVFFILCSRFLFRDRKEASRRVLQFGIVFSNCGFMSLPLQEQVLGEEGLLYGASFVAIFNLLVWSYGILHISGDPSFFRPKKLILNPGIIGLVIGFSLFVFSIPLPSFVQTPIVSLAALNTPLPMLIIGYHLANSDIVKSAKDSACLLSVLWRLIIFPLLALFGMYCCQVRGNLLVSTIISCSAPTAAITTMFASRFQKDVELSVSMVSLSTLVSLFTMPLLVTLAKYLA